MKQIKAYDFFHRNALVWKKDLTCLLCLNILQLTLVLANPEGTEQFVRYNEGFVKSELFKNGFKINNLIIFVSTA